jgi:hypothetical protein
MSAPATTTTAAPAAPAAPVDPSTYQIEDEESFSTEPYQLVWGFSALVALVYAERMNAWYPRNIRDNHITYPDAALTAVSEEWALETREIKAWTTASNQMLVLNGLGVFFWGLNLAVGQVGNMPHKAFFFVSSALRIAPLVSLYHAMYIQRQYLPNGETYDQQVLLAGSVPNKVLYLYNPDVTSTTDAHYLDYSSYYNHLFGLYLVGMITLVCQNVSIAGIKADWIVQNDAWKIKYGSNDSAEEEEVAEPTDEEVVEEAAPEDVFF